jgi:hypothetical protein
LQWAQEQGCEWDMTTCANAAQGGSLELLKWARENGCPWHRDTCAELARFGGHVGVALWVRAQSP